MVLRLIHQQHFRVRRQGPNLGRYDGLEGIDRCAQLKHPSVDLGGIMLFDSRIQRFGVGDRILGQTGELLQKLLLGGRLAGCSDDLDRLGAGGRNIAARVMGLILAAMAVQFMAEGMLELFPGLSK
mgnify:CR=1 FL=1